MVVHVFISWYTLARCSQFVMSLSRMKVRPIHVLRAVHTPPKKPHCCGELANQAGKWDNESDHKMMSSPRLVVSPPICQGHLLLLMYVLCLLLESPIQVQLSWIPQGNEDIMEGHEAGIILCMRPANGRRRLIGWAHTQNYRCEEVIHYELCHEHDEWSSPTYIIIWQDHYWHSRRQRVNT